MHKKISTLMVTTLLLAGCTTSKTPNASSAVDLVSEPVLSDSYLSDFYTAPAKMPNVAGKMIRQEPLPPVQNIPGAAENIRLLYSSTDGIVDQGLIAVSGSLHLPEGDAPAGGWPLLIWSHGTVGIGDQCAPSWTVKSGRDLTYLTYWLNRGYAVAASDYQGLGTAGTHPYMAVRPMAYNNLDLVRAVQSAGYSVSDAVVVAGQSQGASAAISTAIFAPNYAPDIDLRAIVATGVPYFSDAVLKAMAASEDPDAVDPILALTVYGLTLTELVDPDFRLRDIVTDAAWPIVSQVGNACVWDFIGATMQAGLSPRKTFRARYQSAQQSALSAVAYPTLKLDVPLFVGTGEADQITPLGMQTAFVQDACAAGSTIVSRTYPDASHNSALGLSLQDSRGFVADAFEGVMTQSECG